MKKILFLFLFSLFLISCGSNRNHRSTIGKNNHHSKSNSRVNSHHNRNSNNNSSNNKIAKPATKIATVDNSKRDRNESKGTAKGSKKVKQEIIEYAKTFQGTRYKYGGTTRSGMDCSGLISVAFQKENIELPRASRDMATKGVSISLKNIEKGDLIFFKTSSKNVINHVGLVVEADRGQVKFIHSSTRRGVIISSLDEAYWKKAFVNARRVI